MTTATRPRIVYRVTVDGYPIGEGNDREEADDIIARHATRNGRQITQGYQVDVELRKDGE